MKRSIAVQRVTNGFMLTMDDEQWVFEDFADLLTWLTKHYEEAPQ